MGLFGRIAVALALSAPLLLGSNEARAAMADAVSGNSHNSVWRVSDVGLYLDHSLLELPDAGAAVTAALEIWNHADPRLPHVWPVFGAVDDLGYRSGQSNRNTLRYAASGEPRAHGALAITLVSSDGDNGSILDADIVINGVYQFDDNGQYAGQRGSNDNHSGYDLTDVLSHEFGHWFGLPDDFNDAAAIMYPYFDPGETRRRTVSDGDRQALDDLYASASVTDKRSASCNVGVWRCPHQSSGFVAVMVFLVLLRRSPVRRGSSKR